MRSLLLYLILPAVLTGTASAQQEVKVLAAATGKPLDGAVVYYQDAASAKQNLKLTDANGHVSIEVNGKTCIMVHAHGYQPVFDTLSSAGKPLVYSLVQITQNLDQLVITGQYEAGAAKNSTYQIRVIDRKRIELQGAVNLKDVLSNELNIRISNDNVLGSSLSLQGVSGQNIKILIDGVPLLGRLNGNIDLNQINMNNIERIEIIEGPMSVMYGTDALGGVINLITRKGTRQVEAGANGYYESIGTWNFDGYAGFRTKKLSLQASGGRNFFEGYSPTGIRAKQWKPRTQYYADLGINFNIGKSTQRWQTSFFNEKLSDRGNAIITPYQAYALDDYYYTTRITNSLFSTFRLRNNANLQLINSFSYYNRDKNTYRKDLTNGEQLRTPSNGDQDTTYFGLDVYRATYTSNKPGRRWNMQFGYDVNNEKGKGDRIEGEQQILDAAAFFSAEIKPSARLAIKPGLRISHNSRYGHTWVDDPEDNWFTNALSYVPLLRYLNDVKFTPAIPSLNVKYHLSENLVLRGSYARGFRAPSLKELSLLFVDVNHNIKGNPDLKAESSNNFSLSGAYEISKRKLQMVISSALFYNSITDQINLVLVDAPTNLYTYRNIDHYKTTGGTVSAEMRYRNASLTLGYGQTARYNYLSAYYNLRTYNWSPEFRVNGGYHITKTGTDVSVFYKFNGSLPGYALSEQGEVQSTRIGSYGTFDATVSQPFCKKMFSITAGVKNLLNVTNISYNVQGGVHGGSGGSMNMGYGRTWFLTLRVNFVKLGNNS